jgi:hypothetical protein
MFQGSSSTSNKLEAIGLNSKAIIPQKAMAGKVV